MMTIFEYIQNSFKQLFINRTEVMGIAMLMVLFYHFQSIWFYPGFLGVDIFLFLSGYGLSRSYEQNSLSTFYKKRMMRILPLYILMGFGMSLIYYISYSKPLSFWDVFCNISSLNYWGLGGEVPEWYLSFLLILYLTFPMVYVVSKKCSHFYFHGENRVQVDNKIFAYAKLTGGGILFLLAILFLSELILTKDMKWYYETAIGRIPIFILGVMCYPYNSYSKKLYLGGLLSFALLFILSVPLYFNGYLHTYVLLYWLSPVCILFVAFFMLVMANAQAFKIVFNWLGKYSLEIYVANVLLCLYRKAPDSIFNGQSILYDAIFYFAINTALAFVLVEINKTIHFIGSGGGQK